MNKEDIILITGADGMVGKTLVIELTKQGYSSLLTPNIDELDLIDAEAVNNYFKNNKIDYVFHLAAMVGGIQANIEHPVEFLRNNLLISCNIFECAKKYNVKKLINLGSSCIYPKECKQPMKEEYLLDGKPEPTNEGYALAKICSLKLCEYYNKQHNTKFISLMPPNMYGIYDHFNSDKSHVISALISKIHNAKVNEEDAVEIWGSGKARREFLYVGDCVDAMLHFIDRDVDGFVNIGTSEDISIYDLAESIKEIIGFKGALIFDLSKPDGMMKKLMDSSKSRKYGWCASICLSDGIKKTYEWYKNEM